jgi:hypothetical protein
MNSGRSCLEHRTKHRRTLLASFKISAQNLLLFPQFLLLRRYFVDYSSDNDNHSAMKNLKQSEAKPGDILPINDFVTDEPAHATSYREITAIIYSEFLHLCVLTFEISNF